MPDSASRYSHLFWWLVVLSTTLLVSVPHHAYYSIYGEWFTLGWPFAGQALKVGYISPDSPRGPHLFFSFCMLYNVALWLALYFGAWRVVQAGRLTLRLVCGAAVVALLASAIFFGFGVAHLIVTLQAEYRAV